MGYYDEYLKKKRKEEGNEESEPELSKYDRRAYNSFIESYNDYANYVNGINKDDSDVYFRLNQAKALSDYAERNRSVLGNAQADEAIDYLNRSRKYIGEYEQNKRTLGYMDKYGATKHAERTTSLDDLKNQITAYRTKIRDKTATDKDFQDYNSLVDEYKYLTQYDQYATTPLEKARIRASEDAERRGKIDEFDKKYEGKDDQNFIENWLSQLGIIDDSEYRNDKAEYDELQARGQAYQQSGQKGIDDALIWMDDYDNGKAGTTGESVYTKALRGMDIEPTGDPNKDAELFISRTDKQGFFDDSESRNAKNAGKENHLNYIYSLDKIAYDEGVPTAQLTPEERAIIYAYISYGTDDSYNQAVQFMRSLVPALHQREEAQAVQERSDLYQKEGGFTGTLHAAWDSLMSIPGNIVGSPLSAADMAEQYLTTGKYDPYKSELGKMARDARTTRAAVADALTDQTESSIPAFLYNTAMSVGENLVGAGMASGVSAAAGLTGSALGENLYLFAMGTSAGVSRAEELYQRGANPDEMLIGSLTAGINEALFEKVSLDKLLKADPHTAKELILTGLAQSGIEGSEELATEIGNIVADDIFIPNLSDYQNDLNTFLNEGMSYEEAKKKAGQEQLSRIAEATLSGFLAGFGSSAGHIVPIGIHNIRSNIESGKNIASNDAADYVVQQGLQQDEGTEARKLAERINNTKEGKKISNYKLGTLAWTLSEDNARVSKETREQIREFMDNAASEKTIAEALAKKGMTEEEAQKVTPAVVKAINGEQMNRAERRAVQFNDAAQEYVKEVEDTVTSLEEKESSASMESLLTQEFASTRGGSETAATMKANLGEAEVERLNTAKEGTRISEDNVARQISTGNEIDLASSRIESIKTTTAENGAKTTDVKIRLQNGETVSMNDVSFANSDQAIIYETLANTEGMTAQNMNTFVKMRQYVDKNVSAGVWAQGVAEGYKLGYKFADNPKGLLKVQKSARYLSNIGKDARDAALKYGRQAAKVGTIREAQTTERDAKNIKSGQSVEAQHKRVQNVAARLGMKIVYDDTLPGDGAYVDGRTVYLRHDTADPVAFVFKHELTHFAEKSPSYRAYVEAVENSNAFKEWLKKQTIDNNSIAQMKVDYQTELEERYKMAGAENVDAESEMIANFSADVLFTEDGIGLEGLIKGVNAQQRNAILRFFDKFIKWLGSKLGIKSAEVSRLQQMYAKAVATSEGAQTQSTTEQLAENGIGIDENGNAMMHSIRFLPGENGVSSESEIATMLSAQTGRSYEDCLKWVKAERSLASTILMNPEFLDFEADDRYQAIKQNSDYPQGTVDLSNLCRKRVEFTTMFDMLQKMYPDKLFTATDVAKMRALLDKAGIDVACGACFVEDRRQHVGETAAEFIKNYKRALTNNSPLTSRTGKTLKVSEYTADFYKIEKGNNLYASDPYIPNQYDLTTYEGFQALQKEHPVVAQGFTQFNRAYGQNSARLIEGRAEYKRQILDWSSDKVKDVNDFGGLRIFSFSDFETVHLLDLVQVIEDCAARGVKIQGYTKVPEFARLVRNTGIKLNRSLIPKGDTGVKTVNGKKVLDYDTKEGININDKDFLDERDNPNVGNILIGINAEQIGLAFTDDFVDYIIPFHTSKAGGVLRELGTGEWQNYKNSQTEKDAKTGKTVADVNIYTEVIDKYNPKNKTEFVNAFLEECRNQNKKPRYAEFLNKEYKADGFYSDEGGNFDYTYREGYHKLIIDFKMFDRQGNILPQQNITPNLDESFMQEILTREVDRRTNYKFPQNVFNEIVAQFGESSEAINTVEQKISSAKTSIKQVPALFNNPNVTFGKTNVDIGGGKYDLATQQLARNGTTNYVFDPFNRSEDENARTLDFVKTSGGADTATCANVLNVIAEKGARDNVILEMAKAIKKDGTAYFMVYEGDGSGVGRETSSGWQNNRKTADYYDEIKQYFNKVSRKGKLITATEPKANLPKATWETAPGKGTQYSISDRDYLSAVESGDMKTAQKMVDEAAKAAGYTFGKVYHGTPNSDFTVFKNGIIFFTSNEDTASEYQDPGVLWATRYDKGRTIGAYIKLDNPLTLDNSYSDYRNEHTPWQEWKPTAYGRVPENAMNAREVAERAKAEGYDGVFIANDKDTKWTDSSKYLKNRGRGDTVIAFKSNQVKSADPITYDNKGNVIPLSERFNPANDDIRYSIPLRGHVETENERLGREWIEKGEKYGYFPEGEHNETGIKTPQQVSDYTRVYRFVRTVLEDGRVSEDMIRALGKETLLGNRSYEPVSDEAASEYAQSVNGGQAEAIWNKAIAKSVRPVTKNEIAVGEMLLRQAVERGDIKEALEIEANLSRIFTEAGRTVQAASMFKRMTPWGQLISFQKRVDILNQKSAKKGKGRMIKISENLSRKLLEAKTEQEREAAAEEIKKDIGQQIPATFIDKLNAWRYIAMLFNPKTHVRNIIGNGIFVPAVYLKDVVATALERKGRFFTSKGWSKVDVKDRTKVAKVKSEYMDFAKQYLSGDKTALQKFKAAFSDKYVTTMAEKSLRQGGYGNQVDEIEQNKRVYKNTVLETLRNITGATLEGEDILFKNLHYQHAFASFLQSRKVDLNNVSEKTLQQAHKYAKDQAYKNTYNDANTLTTALNAFHKASKGTALASDALLPFRKTPVNIIRRAVEYSPLGLVNTLAKNSYDLRKGKISTSEYVDKLASGITGTALFAIGAFLKAIGALRVHFKDDEDKFLKNVGAQEYSIELFGKSYTIDWAVPLSIPLIMGGEFKSQLEEHGINWADLGETAWQSLQPIINLSCLQGIQTLIDSAKYAEDGETLKNIGVNIASSYFGQYMPTLLGALNNTLDPVRRTNYTSKYDNADLFVQKMVNTARAKVPGLTFTRQPYIDSWGRTQESGVTERILENFLSPGFYNDIEYTDVDNEVLRVYDLHGDEKVFPKKPPKYIMIGQQRIDLNADEYTEYAIAKGGYSYAYIADLLTNADYKNMTAEQQSELIKELYSYADAKAKAKVSDYDIEGSNKYGAPYAWEQSDNSLVDFYIDKMSEEKKETEAVDMPPETGLTYLKAQMNKTITGTAAEKREYLDKAVFNAKTLVGLGKSPSKQISQYYSAIYIQAFKNLQANPNDAVEKKQIEEIGDILDKFIKVDVWKDYSKADDLFYAWEEKEGIGSNATTLKKSLASVKAHNSGSAQKSIKIIDDMLARGKSTQTVQTAVRDYYKERYINGNPAVRSEILSILTELNEGNKIYKSDIADVLDGWLK